MECIYRCTSTEEESGEELDAFDDQALMRGSLQNGRSKRKWFGRKSKAKQEDPIAEKVSKYGIDPSSAMLDNHPLLIPRKKRASLKDVESSKNVKSVNRSNIQGAGTRASDTAVASRYTKISDKEYNRSMKRPASSSNARDASKSASQTQLFRGRGRGEYQKCDSLSVVENEHVEKRAAMKSPSSNGHANAKVDDPIPSWSNRSSDAHRGEMPATHANTYDTKRQSFASSTRSLSKQSLNGSYNNSAHGSLHSSSAHSRSQHVAQLDIPIASHSPTVRKLSLSAHSYESMASFSSITKNTPSFQARFHEYQAEDWIMSPSMAASDEPGTLRVTDLNENGRQVARGSSSDYVRILPEVVQPVDDKLHSRLSTKPVKSFNSEDSDNPDTRPLLAPLRHPNSETTRRYPVAAPADASSARNSNDSIPFLRRRVSPSHGLIETDEDDSLESEDGKSKTSSKTTDSLRRAADIWKSRANEDMPEREYSGPVDLDDMTIPSRASDGFSRRIGRDETEEDETIRSEEIYDEYIDLAIYEERLDRALLSDTALPDFEIMRKLELIKYQPSEEDDDEELSNIEPKGSFDSGDATRLVEEPNLYFDSADAAQEIHANVEPQPSFDSTDATPSVENAKPTNTDDEKSDDESSRQPLVLIQSSDTSCEISLMQVLDESSEGSDDEYFLDPAVGEAYIDESSGEDDGDNELQTTTVTFAEKPQTHIIPSSTEEVCITDESSQGSVEEEEEVRESSASATNTTEGNDNLLDSTFDEEIVFHTDESSTASSSGSGENTDRPIQEERTEPTARETPESVTRAGDGYVRQRLSLSGVDLEKIKNVGARGDSEHSNHSGDEELENGDGQTFYALKPAANESTWSENPKSTSDMQAGSFSAVHRSASWKSSQVAYGTSNGDSTPDSYILTSKEVADCGVVELPKSTNKSHSFQANVENAPETSYSHPVGESRLLGMKSSHNKTAAERLDKQFRDRSELARGNAMVDETKDSEKNSIAQITSLFEKELVDDRTAVRNFRSFQKSPQHQKATVVTKLGEGTASDQLSPDNVKGQSDRGIVFASPGIKADESQPDSEADSTVSQARNFWATVEKTPLSKDKDTKSPVTGRVVMNSTGFRSPVTTRQNDIGETVTGSNIGRQTQRSSPKKFEGGVGTVTSLRPAGEKWPLSIYRKPSQTSEGSSKPVRDTAAAFVPRNAATNPKNGIHRGYNSWAGMNGKQGDSPAKEAMSRTAPMEKSPVRSNDKKQTVANRFADIKSKFDSAMTSTTRGKEESRSDMKATDGNGFARHSSPEVVDTKESQSVIESEVSVAQARNFWAAVDKSPQRSDSKAGVGSRLYDVKVKSNDASAPALNTFLAKNSIERSFQTNENTDNSSKASNDSYAPPTVEKGFRDVGFDGAVGQRSVVTTNTKSQNEGSEHDQRKSFASTLKHVHGEVNNSDTSKSLAASEIAGGDKAVESNDTGKLNGQSKDGKRSTLTQQKLTPGSDPQKWHDILKDYEARRRLNFQKKLSTTRLHWKSYRDMLDEGAREVARARRLVLGLTKAQGKMARTMAEIPVESSAQKESSILKLIKGDLQHSPKSVVNSRSNGEPSRIDCITGSALLDTLAQARNIVSNTTSGASAEAELSLENRLNNLIQYVQDTLADLDDGALILDELASLEERTQQAWEIYLQASSGSLLAESSQGILGSLFRGSSSNRSIGSLATSSKINASDAWLAEVKYKECSEIQRRTSEEANLRLQEIFEAARNAECFRRLNLREYLIDCIQQQQRVFSGTEESISLVLVTLLERDGDVLDEPKTSFGDTGSSSQTRLGSVFDGKVASFLLDQFNLLAPLGSEMLVHMSVSEVLPRDPQSKPSLTLLVVTSDSILHFFDLFGTGLNVNSRAEEALSALLNLSKATHCGVGRKVRALRPSWTFELGNCKISAGVEDNVVELRVDNPSQRGDWELKIRVGSAREQIALIAGMHGDSSRLHA